MRCAFVSSQRCALIPAESCARARQSASEQVTRGARPRDEASDGFRSQPFFLNVRLPQFRRLIKTLWIVIRLAKILFALAAAAGFAILILALTLAALVHERQTLARKALAKIAQKSGALVTVKGIGLGISTSGLEIVARGANVAYKGDHVRARRLLAVIGYSELAHLRVLPLKSLRLVSAVVELAPAKNSQPFDLRRTMATLSHAAARIAHIAQRASLTALTIEPPGRRNASLALDLRIEASARRTRVVIEHLAWNGPPLDGLSASAVFTVPSESTQRASGKVAFIRRAANLVRGRTTLREKRPGALSGKIVVSLSAPGPLRRDSFAGSYVVRQSQLGLTGTLRADDSLGADGPISLRVTVGHPFSNDRFLTVRTGPVGIQCVAFAHAMGASSLPVAGRVEIGSANLALALAPVQNAVAGCRDAPCRTHRALAAIISGAVASLTVASAHLESQKSGLGAVDLNSPLTVTLRNGVANAGGLSARTGAVTIKRGELSANLLAALGPAAPVISYSAQLFSGLDLGRLDWGARTPPWVSKLMPRQGFAYAQVSLAGTLTNEGSGFKPQKLKVHLRQGSLWFRERSQHEAILFGGDGSLAGSDVLCAAHASLSGGGALLLHARYGLLRRTVQARLKATGLDLRRWTSALLRAGAVKGLTIAGRAKGSAQFKWSPALGQPQVSGQLALDALTVGSPFTTAPVFVPAARVVASNTSLRVWFEHAQAGAGNFSLRGSVADFAAPKIDLAVNGRGFDFDVFRSSAARSGGNHRVRAVRLPARRLKLNASVQLKRVFVHHVELRNFACAINGRGTRWEVRNLSARALHGRLKMRAAWDARTGRVYVTANLYRMNIQRLLARLSRSSQPPVSGELSAKLNAGLALISGSQPQPLCGDSTIIMTNGTLGRVQLLSEIVQLVSVASWLRFQAPDLNTGMPYDRIIIQTALTPHALEVRHLQLSSDLLGLAGHGRIALPDRTLDLHVQALPLASLRWLLSHLPLAGARLGKALNRIFAVRIRISGPAAAPNVSPELFRNPLEALTDVIELPLDFVPESDLPSDVMFKPPRTLSYRKNCSPYQW